MIQILILNEEEIEMVKLKLIRNNQIIVVNMKKSKEIMKELNLKYSFINMFIYFIYNISFYINIKLILIIYIYNLI